MTWLRVSLYQACLGVKSLPPLKLADHITVSHQTLQRQLVPRTRARPATPSPTYIVHQAQPVAQAATSKKKNRVERWDLQAPSLYRPAKVQGPEELPQIWHTLAPLTKEKALPAFEIACRDSAQALRYKAPEITHSLAVLLLGLHFFIEDSDCVNDTVNIFQFPNLSASSKASMVTQRWDTALDANLMTS